MLKIYDSFNKKSKNIKWEIGQKIFIYICGITVYNDCHVGHAKTFISFDAIIRYLSWRQYNVFLVRNITDIDDKIIYKSIIKKKNIDYITKKYIHRMHEGFHILNLLIPKLEPRATDFIQIIIYFIEHLLYNKFAYLGINGSVYYNIKANNKYFSYFNQKLKKFQKPGDLNMEQDKKSPGDFVLWKKFGKNEIGWQSPWGNGRPGWHIECSSMIIYYFGNQCNIHGGGIDLKFPHHHNEVAQSDSLINNKHIDIWMHTGLLKYNHDKISKAKVDKFLLIKSLTNINSEILRSFILSSHYRSEITYSKKKLYLSKIFVIKLYSVTKELFCSNKYITTNHKQLFIRAMNQDFNTSLALSILLDLSNKIIFLKSRCKYRASGLLKLLIILANSIGLLLYRPNFLFPKHNYNLEKIKLLINKRNVARYKKSWIIADSIRLMLLQYKIKLKDLSNKTMWFHDII